MNRSSPLVTSRWRQFSLRTLLLLMLMASVLSAWIAHQRNEAAQQRAAYRLIAAKGGASNFGPESSLPAWLCAILGADVAANGGCIVFYRPDLTDADVQTLSSLRNLQRLSLDQSPITDQGIAHLAKLPRLRHLRLNETKVTNAGLQSLRRCRALKFLSLRGTSTTDTGVQQLQTSLPSLVVIDAKDREWPELRSAKGGVEKPW